MKNLMKGWFVFTLFVLVGCAASTPPAVGDWSLTMQSPLGEQQVNLSISADGTGRFSIPALGAPPAEVEGITFDGNSVTLSADVSVQGNAIAFDFEGTIEGDSLTGAFNTDFGALEVEGTRQ